ncbi:MAG: CCA tRNA nucleotidyltransferase [Paracoccus sp. (in: a-proteobacteria)]|uniref:CCA tRNA nucleotidyltransferase n=1 Tax=Paracoccus sp. TaxID=267 RepID=UPI0026E09568|nr:CCA tRNA nucleotidyltransferase [Paracoccus sp. (in: a-proteobacteria)]MDO5621789.1 CCA tRNA nucleotidyltransferase [Paracoccus sp. (in: a-proteobacteria)]
MTDRINADFLTRPGFRALAALFAAQGWRLWAVGGCVRDVLLNRPVGDIDLCSDAAPDQVIAAAETTGMHCIPTGLAHGTVTVIFGDEPYEITALRQDTETFGRHATVTFTDDLAQDAARRDLTMNALYLTPDGLLVDPLNGLPDLLAQRVRFVGDPARRIAEDYLRILRFFRFFAWYGRPGQADAAALTACAKGRAGLAQLSRERIGQEIRRLLAAPDPVETLNLMQETGVLQDILPGADPAPVTQLGAAGWQARLAALAPFSVTDALRLSKAESRHHDQILRAAEQGWSLDRIGYHLPPDTAVDAAALAGLREPGWQERLTRAAAARLPISAAELPDLSGPAIGTGLRAAETEWIASGFNISKQALIQIAKGQT